MKIFKKLNTRGVAHQVALVVIVLGVAAFGTYQLVKNFADTLPSASDYTPQLNSLCQGITKTAKSLDSALPASVGTSCSTGLNQELSTLMSTGKVFVKNDSVNTANNAACSAASTWLLANWATPARGPAQFRTQTYAARAAATRSALNQLISRCTSSALSIDQKGVQALVNAKNAQNSAATPAPTATTGAASSLSCTITGVPASVPYLGEVSPVFTVKNNSASTSSSFTFTETLHSTGITDDLVKPVYVKGIAPGLSSVIQSQVGYGPSQYGASGTVTGSISGGSSCSASWKTPVQTTAAPQAGSVSCTVNNAPSTLTSGANWDPSISIVNNGQATVNADMFWIASERDASGQTVADFGSPGGKFTLNLAVNQPQTYLAGYNVHDNPSSTIGTSDNGYVITVQFSGAASCSASVTIHS